jgi:hypothetical protein
MESEDPDQLKEQSKESIERIRKMVQEYGKSNPKDDTEPPLIDPSVSN